MRDLRLDRLLLRTDAPFLAPVPMRGRTTACLSPPTLPGCWPRFGGCRWPRSRARPPPTSPAVHQGRARAHEGAGLGTSRRAADRLRLSVCRSPDPRNHVAAARSSSRPQGQRILVDTGPDLHQQSLDYGIGGIDALLYTHPHADHVHGIDDIHSINNVIMAPIPACADAAVFARIHKHFPYVFDGGRGHGWWRPGLNPTCSTALSGWAPLEVIPFSRSTAGA